MKIFQARLMKTLLSPMLAALAFAPLADSARAALTPIADAPLISISVVKPNIMFTLDNSGSMAWQSITGADALGQYSNAKRGFYSNDYNGIYYDPNVTYLPGVTADGTSMGNSPPAAAANDPYLAPAGAKTDVTGLCYTKNTNPTQTLPVSTNCSATKTATYQFGPYAKYAYYYVWDGAGSKTADASYPTRVDIMPTVTDYSRESAKRADCAAAKVGNPPPAMINCTYAEEIQNFANWYSYYRSRILMTKTSVGRAFTIVDPIAVPVNTPKVRVGFNTITDAGGAKNSDVADGKYWLTIRDFDTAQKTAWYSKLYAINPANGTPLRTAMQKIGELYRGKLAGAADPVQYSCQPNNHILATDGYWNDAAEPVLPSIDTNYAGINGGNLDGFAANPNATRADGAIDVNGAKNSLADVAMLYYSKDLRDGSMNNCTGALGLDVCKNEVPTFSGTPSDLAEYQHMRTYTIGLGANGTKPYQSDYRTATSGFFYELTHNLNQPASNWPLPVKDDPTAIDDLWHAAVNGHGIYLNAKNSNDLQEGLAAILASATQGGIAAGVALAGAVLTSPENDKAYAVSFSGDWAGEVLVKNIDPKSAAVSASYDWGGVAPNPKGAQAKLDELAAGDGWDKKRNIVTMKGGAGVPFRWDDLSAAQQTALVSKNVLDYLRGRNDKVFVADGKFRVRAHLLGDIVDSGVAVVGAPKPLHFSDSYNPGFNDFAEAHKGRTKMLYVGANDGMLHAFDAATGVERWAYIPSMLIKSGSDGLAALSYMEGGVPQFNHHFYVNQTPRWQDVDFANKGTAGGQGSGKWRTILVGGLNKGGKGFYAIDITDPDAMTSEDGVKGKVLWEFTDPKTPDNMGYSFGQPLITKTRAYGWVVMVTSGYNNASGKGVLYVLDAETGVEKARFYTKAPGEGPGNPSGLARFTGYTLDYGDYTTEQVYGGDLFGNMWRFDVSNSEGGAWLTDATLFAQTEAGQPITAAPQIEVDLKTHIDRWVFFGTGKYLDPSDNATLTTQTMYAIKDGTKATPTNTGLPFSKSNLVASIGIGSEAPIPTDKQGWYVDLSPGERITIDPVANEQVIGWITAIPTDDACSPGGASGRVYARRYSSGYSVADSGVGLSPPKVAYKENAKQYVKIQFVKADGKIKLIATDAGGNVTTISGTWGPQSGIAVRLNSREILN